MNSPQQIELIMKLIINRITKVNTQLFIDPKLIDYQSLINDFSNEGIEMSYELNSANLNDFLEKNNDQLATIFNILINYGHGNISDDIYADESDFYISKES